MMKLSVLALAASLAGLASAAEAMPAAPFAHGSSNVIQADWQCGHGAHITPWGHCAPNDWRGPPPRVFYRHGPPEYGFYQRGPDDRYAPHHDYAPRRHHQDWNEQ